MNQEGQKVALAALLHDIGKFWQRTGQPPVGYEGFAEEDYGPHGAHAKWSAAFVSEYLPAELREGLSAVLYHHKPQDYLSKLIALADRLSAGEREEEEVSHSPSLLRSVLIASNSMILKVTQSPHLGNHFIIPFILFL